MGGWPLANEAPGLNWVSTSVIETWAALQTGWAESTLGFQLFEHSL